MTDSIRKNLIDLLDRIGSDAKCDWIVPSPKPQDGDTLEVVTLDQRLDAAKVMIAAFTAFDKADKKGGGDKDKDEPPSFTFDNARQEKQKVETAEGKIQ